MSKAYFNFNEAFLRNLPDDVISGARQILDHACDLDQSFFRENEPLQRVEAFLWAYQFYRGYCSKHGLECLLEEPGETVDAERVSEFLQSSLIQERERVRQLDNSRTYARALEEATERANRVLDTGFVYELSDGDLKRIQDLLNSLRSEITQSEIFDTDHRYRLLSRLEKLQSELHKKMSNLDRFWGLFIEAGVMLGKFGTDVKPLVDRIGEIVNIVWRVQARAEQLPSDEKLVLPSPASDSEIKAIE